MGDSLPPPFVTEIGEKFPKRDQSSRLGNKRNLFHISPALIFLQPNPEPMSQCLEGTKEFLRELLQVDPCKETDVHG